MTSAHRSIHGFFRLALMMLVLGAMLPCSSAGATIVLHLDLETLSVESSSIMVGRVETVASRWVGGTIVTDTVVRTAVSVKGAQHVGDRVTVRTLGGRVGDLAQRVAGEPDFEVGEDVLLFVDEAKAGRPPTVMGMAQGKFRVALGPDMRLWAVRDTSELSLAVMKNGADGHPHMQFVDQGELQASGALPLDDLVRAAASHLRAHDQALAPGLLDKLGDDLLRPYDFRRELGLVGVGAIEWEVK